MIPPTLPIPLPVNAKLTLFKTLQDIDDDELGDPIGYEIDPMTGNEIVPVEAIDVTASFTRDFTESRLSEDPGADMEMMRLIGFIHPVPEDIAEYKLDGTVPAEFTELGSGRVSVGEFTFNRVTTPFNQLLNPGIGLPIRGFFKLVEGK